MNTRMIGVLFLALMLLVGPVTSAQMMGDGMMKGGQKEMEKKEEGRMPMMHKMMDEMMEMMKEMMEGMKGMAQDQPTKQKMEEMMKKMDEMMKQHDSMMGGMMGGSGMGSSGMKPSKEGAAASSLATQKNSGGGVTVEATLLNPKTIGEKISLQIKLDTHSVNLDQYDLSGISRLRDDEGKEFSKPTLEKPEGEGHHKGGILAFSNKDKDGKPIVTANTKYIELIVKDVAGVAERTFRWELTR